MLGWFPGSLRRKFRLSPVEILILFGLNGRNLSGYALMESIAEETSERIRLKSGTLYPALKRLTRKNPPLVSYDKDAREYGLTDAGRQLLTYFPEQVDSAFEVSEQYLAFIVKHGGPKHYKAMCDRMLAKRRPWAFPWIWNFAKELKEDKDEQINRLARLREQLAKRLETVDQQIEDLKRGNNRGKT
ncbi:MAG: PadR family transcriptional regulator [Candidatus Heimdallarchaeota archaeon]